MNPQSRMPPGSRSRIWQRISVALIAGVLLYYTFVALNAWSLPEHTSMVTVLDKAYYPPGTSYQTMNIGGRIFFSPHGTAAASVLKLKLNDREVGALVEKGLYDPLSPSDEVQVIYQRARMTGTLRVTQVTAHPQKGGP
jgi:hypothetical protein